VTEYRPNPGPQEAFLSSPADIALFGGSAGSGKSMAMLMDPLRHVHRRGYAAIMFRRESTRLRGAGSLWDESQKIYMGLGAKARQTPDLEWRFRAGSTIELRHLQYESDKFGHQGKQYSGIYWDEVCEFTESQFLFLWGRCRTTIGIRPYMRGTCNPDPDSFVRRWIDWWIGEDGFPRWERSGVLRWFVRDGDDMVWFDSRDEATNAFPGRDPISFTFIPARLEDNPLGVPTYRGRLESLDLVTRKRMLDGNWDIRAAGGTLFRRGWFRVIDPVNPRDIEREVRSWDLAASEVTPTNKSPDATVGARIARLKDGTFVIRDMKVERFTPAKVDDLIRTTAADDGKRVEIALPQDPGQAGKSQAQRYARELASQGYTVRTHRPEKDKVTYAKPVSSLAEHGAIARERGVWNEALIAELEAFPEGAHDDRVDAVTSGIRLLGTSTVRYAPSAPLAIGYSHG